MQIEYKNNGIKKVCTNVSYAEKKYGREMAKKIHLRIDQICSADSVEEMIQYRVGKCHALHQNREGQYAVDLVQPQRLVFEKKENEIKIVNIIEVIDYH